jgi:thiol-disulfide isomerase/thioredoxin
MSRSTFFSRLLSGWILVLLCLSAQAEEAELKPFMTGSYQKILESHANQPLMLVMWSIDCPSCLKDMALISSIHKKKPELKIIMLATDDLTASDQIQQIVAKNQLSDLDNWVFADENTQKLRFEIDPKWYGEIPRTYFFDAAHHREGVSGVLTSEDYETRIARLLK